MFNLVCLCLIVTGAEGLKFNQHSWSQDLSVESTNSEIFDGQQLWKDDPEAKPVFFAIIMGKLAYRHQVSLWLSSLRNLGQYKDEVVLVTDKPDCLAVTLKE